MTIEVTLNRLDGGSHTVHLAKSEYVTDSAGNVIAFADFDHRENEIDYYVIYKLRMRHHDHSSWFRRGVEALKDLTRPGSWALTGMKFGDFLGGRSGGPRQAARGGKIGFLAGFCLAEIWPVLRNQFFEHYENDAKPTLCYVDSGGNEAFSGPIVIR